MISILGGSPHYPHSCYSAREWLKLKEKFQELANDFTDSDVALYRHDVIRMVDYCQKKYEERIKQYGLE